MARPLRIEYPGAFYHITARGNERKKIFFAKSDYDRFKSCLKEAGSPANTAHAKQHDKEQHCDTNAKSMKLEGTAKSEYLEHCYHENDFDKNAKPHPKH